MKNLTIEIGKEIKKLKMCMLSFNLSQETWLAFPRKIESTVSKIWKHRQAYSLVVSSQAYRQHWAPARTTFQTEKTAHWWLVHSKGKGAYLSKSKTQPVKHFGYSWVKAKEIVNQVSFQLPWKSCSQIIYKCNLLFLGWEVTNISEAKLFGC